MVKSHCIKSQKYSRFMPGTVFGSVKELKESQCESVSLALSSFKLLIFIVLAQILKLFASLSTPTALSLSTLSSSYFIGNQSLKYFVLFILDHKSLTIAECVLCVGWMWRRARLSSGKTGPSPGPSSSSDIHIESRKHLYEHTVALSEGLLKC